MGSEAGTSITSSWWEVVRKGASEWLELSPDGTGCLVRGTGEVLRGKWHEKSGELRFTLPSGEFYMGRVEGGEIPKGVMGRGPGQISGRFTARNLGPPPSLPSLPLELLPPAPSPLPSVLASVQYMPEFVSEDDQAILLAHVRRAESWRWTGGGGRRTVRHPTSPAHRSLCTLADACPSDIRAVRSRLCPTKCCS